MTNFTFNKKEFFRTVFIFIILTTVWTILCIVADEFTDTDKGFVTGLGFLVLIPLSIYFGQKLSQLAELLILITLTIITFLIGSFILGPLVGGTSDSMAFYSIVNSIFVSTVMTIYLNKITKIDFIELTVILTFSFLLIAYFVFDKYSDSIYLKYNIHPRMTMFNVFQFALIIPLTIGMTVKRKPAHNCGLAQ